MSRGPKRDARRCTDMAAMYLTGATLQQVGDYYGVTRERVRQIVTREGMTRDNGGVAIRRARRMHAHNTFRDHLRNEKARQRFGCDHATVVAIQRGDGLSKLGTPAQIYTQQRRNSAYRGIEWSMSLPEWLRIWQESGHWIDRGKGHGKYVMARRGDVGPYAAWNVYITGAVENIQHGYAFRRLRKAQEPA